MVDLFGIPLPEPWGGVLSVFFPLLVPLPFIVMLALIATRLGAAEATPVSLVQRALEWCHWVRDEEANLHGAAWWAVVAVYSLFVVGVEWLDIWVPERGIPWHGFLIGLVATAVFGLSLFNLIPMLRIGRDPRGVYRNVPASLIALGSVALLTLGLICTVERTELLLAVSGNEVGVKRLREEIGELERRDDRLRVVWLDQEIVSNAEAARALSEEDGELIVYGDIEDVTGETVATSLRVLDKWELLPMDRVPETFMAGPCPPPDSSTLLRGAAVQTSSVAAFALAYLDVLREGPHQALKTLTLACETAQRIECEGVKEATRKLAHLAYAEMLKPDYGWADEVEDDFLPLTHEDDEGNYLEDQFVWRYWGELQLREADLGDAVDAFERAVTIDRGYLDAYIAGGKAAFQGQQYCRAGMLFKEFNDQWSALPAEKKEEYAPDDETKEAMQAAAEKCAGGS